MKVSIIDYIGDVELAELELKTIPIKGDIIKNNMITHVNKYTVINTEFLLSNNKQVGIIVKVEANMHITLK